MVTLGGHDRNQHKTAISSQSVKGEKEKVLVKP